MDFNPEFVSRMIPKLDWNALCKAAENVFYIFYALVGILILILCLGGTHE